MGQGANFRDYRSPPPPPAQATKGADFSKALQKNTQLKHTINKFSHEIILNYIFTLSASELKIFILF